MNGLRFISQAPVVPSAPTRVDVACFVGFVGLRPRQGLPPELERWLEERGWTLPRYGRTPITELLDIPIPIDAWDIFDGLFAWETRDLDGLGQTGTSYLGAAVRSFFAQGGRKCYVVRVDDPWPLMTRDGSRRGRRDARLGKLIPGYPHGVSASPVDQESWRGVGHLFGLPDVSFLCMPDLADVVGTEEPFIDLPEPLPPPEERFVECSEPQPPSPPDSLARLFRAPRCEEDGYQAWARALRLTTTLIAGPLREVQLVAAVPIPQRGTPAERDLLGFLADGGNGLLAAPMNEHPNGLASAFLQLAYPWVRTAGSGNLPEQIESPDAVLAGILARNALARGAFRSAAGLPVADVYDVHPSLSRDQMLRAVPNAAGHALLDRVSLLGPTPGGLRLLSDVTTSLDESYRPAGVNRLVSLIVRASRELGEDIVFESSGELLWARVREQLDGLLLTLLQGGALRGSTPGQAFQVRCDRSTMSQNDIDNGRVIAQIQFNAAAAIDRITIVLAMAEGGRVSLASQEPVREVAA